MPAIGFRGILSARSLLPRGRRSGTIIIIVVFALVALLACAALTIDLGTIYMKRSQLQGACDAAALAGAAALPTIEDAKYQAAAYYARNITQSDTEPDVFGGAYSIAGDTVVVTTPYSDAYTDAKGWEPDDLLQVQTTTTVPLTFASALGMPSRTMVVSAVALRTGGAGNGWGLGEGALFALDQGFAISCNTFKVTGTVAANSDINMSLNIVDIGNVLHAKWRNKISANQIRGGFRLEYGTTYDISCNHADIGSIVKTPQTDLVPPITYDPAEWATDFDVDQTYASLTINQSNYQHPAGTTRVNGNLTINANNTDLRDCTFIVGGHVTINTNNLYLGYHEKCMCFYLTGVGSTININMNNISVQGDIYAPLGYINCSSNNIHRGWWVARRIAISCNNFELDGIPARASSGSALMLVE